MARLLKPPKQDYSRWSPWDIDDWDVLRQLSEKSATAAIERCGVTDGVQVTRLRADISNITREYLMTKRGVTMPPPRWYREQITPLLTATEALLKIIRRPLKGTSRTFVEMKTQDLMNRPLRGVPTEPQSVEELLERFRVVCIVCIGANKNKRGPIRELHVEEAVASLSRLWERISGNRVSMSFTKAPGHHGVMEFSSPGLHFCQVVLQSIDPDVSISQIETALRKNSGKPTKKGSEIEHKGGPNLEPQDEAVESYFKLWERIRGNRGSRDSTTAKKSAKRKREMPPKTPRET